MAGEILLTLTRAITPLISQAAKNLLKQQVMKLIVVKNDTYVRAKDSKPKSKVEQVIELQSQLITAISTGNNDQVKDLRTRLIRLGWVVLPPETAASYQGALDQIKEELGNLQTNLGLEIAREKPDRAVIRDITKQISRKSVLLILYKDFIKQPANPNAPKADPKEVVDLQSQLIVAISKGNKDEIKDLRTRLAKLNPQNVVLPPETAALYKGAIEQTEEELSNLDTGFNQAILSGDNDVARWQVPRILDK